MTTLYVPTKTSLQVLILQRHKKDSVFLGKTQLLAQGKTRIRKCYLLEPIIMMKCFRLCNRDRNEAQKTPNPNPVSDSPARPGGNTGSPFPNSSHRSTDLRVFTLPELKQATKNFSLSAKLGEGGFGCVFKGVVSSSDEKIQVAIKQHGKNGQQGYKQWLTEVNVLGSVEHPNLVKLIGYCAEDDERGIQRLLVYECMPNGSVADHLSSKSATSLPWAARLGIALDAACGLAYLHEEMDFQIIFRDFKSSNILLGDQWNAKLSDFGLARLGPTEGLSHVSTEVAGTMGYAAPEYVQTGHLTSKSDVYSYGVFLYELITGRRPLERNLPRNEQKLMEWIKPYLADPKKFPQVLDQRLERKQILRSALKLSIVANRCLAKQAKSRPKMSQVKAMVSEVVMEEASKGAACGPEPHRECTGKGKRSDYENRPRGLTKVPKKGHS